ncbi:MAG TPA: hypothetical protein VK789_21495 [Bryobacteraceae bacterium]|nr:hypothetical protein [Bryobacteraceae bacterium]
MIRRTLRPRTPTQSLHQDIAEDRALAGFIFMVDEFRRDNGATCFLVGERLVPAGGPAGSMIVFNGSRWHGHGANETHQPRRSMQGTFIRREDAAGDTQPD